MANNIINAISNNLEADLSSDVNKMHLFKPVRCTENQVFNTRPIDGAVYFTTDTQKIYVGTSAETPLKMYDNHNFFYGKLDIEYNNSGNQPDPNVNFSVIDDIEGNKNPEVNDLILNKDGCFYRVDAILDEVMLKTTRLTLQGTGGGGGGSDIEGLPSLSITSTQGGAYPVRYFSAQATSAIIDVKAYSSDKTNRITEVVCSFDSDFRTLFHSEYGLSVAMEEVKEINIVKQIPKMSTVNANKVYVRVIDQYGTSRDFYYTIYIGSMQLSTTVPQLFSITNDEYSYTCNITSTKGLSDRKIIYTLQMPDGSIVPGWGEQGRQEYDLEDSDTSATKTFDNLQLIPHGDYILRVQAVCNMGGTTISSNVLSHKLLRYTSDVNQAIFSVLEPNFAEQYTQIPIYYLLAYKDDNNKYALDIKINDSVYTTQMITSNILGQYNLEFDTIGQYKINLSIAQLGISYEFTLNVTKYTGILPTINLQDGSLLTYFTAKGRTNNSSDKELWPDYKNSNLKAKLEGFYFRDINGWMLDTEKVPYLRVSQQAKLLFDNYSFLDKYNRNTGMTFELDFKLSGITNYASDAYLLQCVSIDDLGELHTGFRITGDKFTYYHNKTAVSEVELVTDKRLRITYVVEPITVEKQMCFTYINGILSHAYAQPSELFFGNVGNKAYLQADSEHGCIDIYNIRFYSKALNHQQVLTNYQADLSPLEYRQYVYEDNNIYTNGVIDLDKIEADNYEMKIPYVKIIGGFSATKKFVSDTSTVQALPTGKSDYRLVDIEVHYPTEKANSHFKGYSDFILSTTYDDPSLDVLTGGGKEPNTGTIIYAQGTSSMGYPVKNLRAKFKGKGIKVRPDLPEVNLICFKADYMESSGSHNTGAGNFIDAVYSGMGMKTPGQEKYGESTVTCIKGHPCVIFWSKTGEPGTFQYIGKYNLNLDKATPEPFGFKQTEGFGYLDIGDEFEDESMNYDEEDNYNFSSCDEHSAIHKVVIADDEPLEDGKIHQKDTNSIFCFEFLDNNAQVCNFLPIPIYDESGKITGYNSYRDSWYGTFNGKPGWRSGFESRYPEDKEGYHDADALFEVASWIAELYAQYKIEISPNMSLEERNALPSVQAFKAEYKAYFDTDFLLAYYIITEALLMADSRVKNMMIATWGREEREYTDRNGQKQISNNYIWYPIFYDMDTMLGLDNIGKVGQKLYWSEDTTEAVFNGEEALWKLVRDAFPNELDTMYNNFENTNNLLTLDGVLPYFNDNQATMANETFYNEDSMYKYILPYRAGFTIDEETAEELGIEAGDRLYAAQGSRDLMREWFIYNRLRYLRGKRNSDGFKKKDIIEFRITYPTEQSFENTEHYEAMKKSIAAVPPSGKFDLTAMNIGYVGVTVGANVASAKKLAQKNETVSMELDVTNANGTELYINGASILSNIGRLDDKYLYGFDAGKIDSNNPTSTANNNITDLKLGNSHRDYYNPYWTNETLDFTPFKYLTNFDFMNNKTFRGTLNFSNCRELETLIASGTQASTVTLPVSGVLKELRLPNTITSFVIDSHPELTDEKFSIGTLSYPRELDDPEYVNDFTKLSYVKIVDTPQIDSYGLVKDALYGINGTSVLYKLTVHGFDWIITDNSEVEIEGNTLKSINVLEKIKERMFGDEPKTSPYDDDTKVTEALRGHITVNVGDLFIDEFNMYQKYNSYFPNVTIEYISNNKQPASFIKFYSNPVLDGQPYYTVLTNGTMSLDYLTSESGPVGKKLAVPQWPATPDTVYAFDDKWRIAASSDNNYKVNDSIYVEYENDEMKFTNEKGNSVIFAGDVSLCAIYKDSPREYTVKLYDDDGKTVLFDSASIGRNLHLGDKIGQKFKDIWQISYHYKPYDGNQEHHRYTFKGWSSSYDFGQEPQVKTYDSLDEVLIAGNFVAYAYYELEDAREKPFDSKYFTFETVSISINKGITFNKTYGPGVKININPLYRDCLQGKITLPNSYDNQNIMFIGNFNHLPLAEEVYLLDGNKYIGCDGSFGTNIQNRLKAVYLQNATELEFINTCSFANCNQLESIDINGSGRLGEKLRFIGYGAFSANSPLSSNLPAVSSGTASELTSTDYYMQVYINGLPESLEDIQGHAFNSNISMNPNIHINKLPDKLQIINEYTFRNCPNVKILDFGGPSSRLTAIKQAAFQNAGEGVISINIYAPVQTLGVKNEPNSFIEAGAFSNYPVNGGLKYLNSYQPITSFSSIAGSPIQSWSDVGIANIDNITISEMT